MFEIKHTTTKGIVHFQLVDALPLLQQFQLCKLADDLVGGPLPRATVSSFKKNEFGSDPVEEINMGSYDPPTEGWTIKFSSMPESISQAAKILRDATGISAWGCRQIVCGNYKCPILTEETKDILVDQFTAQNVYCKAERVISIEDFDDLDDANAVITMEDVDGERQRESGEFPISQETQG